MEPQLPKYFITGGRQRPSSLLSRAEWFAYEKAVLIELDTDTGRSRPVLAYESPAGRRPAAKPSFVFKAGAWDGDHLLLCTQTEALWVDPESFEVTGTVSHPWLNDVHHVDVFDGGIHFANTGLDCLIVLEPDGALRRCDPAQDEDLWARFDKDIDYRTVPTTKPHKSHPNYVFRTKHGVWLNRSLDKDAVCMDDRSRVIDLTAPGVPHDGIVRPDGVWFTTTEGHLLQCDPDAAKVVRNIELGTLDPDAAPTRWCRGLHFQDDLAYVGFSRLRPTKARANLSWVKRSLGFKDTATHNSRVTAYDLKAGKLVGSWDMEEHGLNAVFSILPRRPLS